MSDPIRVRSGVVAAMMLASTLTSACSAYGERYLPAGGYGNEAAVIGACADTRLAHGCIETIEENSDDRPDGNPPLRGPST